MPQGRMLTGKIAQFFAAAPVHQRFDVQLHLSTAFRWHKVEMLHQPEDAGCILALCIYVKQSLRRLGLTAGLPEQFFSRIVLVFLHGVQTQSNRVGICPPQEGAAEAAAA